MSSTPPPTTGTLTSRLSPAGRVLLSLEHDPDLAPTPTALVERLTTAFERGTGHGVLHLGAAELDAELDPTLSFWRELGRQLVVAVCGALDPTDPTAIVLPAPSPEVLAGLVAAAPPMRGAETLTVERLEALWTEAGEALAERAAEHDNGVQGHLESCSPVWHVAGRVCLHLAENKRDPSLPFAFLATYARQVPGRKDAQHVPLSHALKEYAGARNKRQLLALLSPLQRAAEHSELMQELVATGDIYHPLAWTPRDTYAFLREIPKLEAAGLVVRLPNWWKARRPPRASVSVTVGDGRPSALGLHTLLDFDVRVTLGGQTLVQAEIDALLAASDGLVLIKGAWVEVDAEKLGQVLAQWQEVAAGGVSFAEASRLLAQADDHPADDARPEWSEVVAGRWLGDQLDALRSPQVNEAIAKGAGLRATLRPYQQAGVQWLWTLHGLGLGGCLADDMGLGKTIQVIALLSMLKTTAAPEVDLLVVPASLLENWRSEIERFAPHLRALIAHPSTMPAARLKALTSAELEPYDLVITTYGTVHRTPWMQEHAWRCLVLDEAQAIKNPGARQTKAIKELRSRWRLALTGTPVENRLGDLWSLFDFLNPGLLGSARAFGKLCSAMREHGTEGYAPLRRLVQPYILRRLKTDRRVITDLPDKTEVTAHCLLTKAQAALYAQSVDELSRALAEAEGIERRGLVLTYLMRFKQICNHPSQWLGDQDFHPEHSGKFERLAALCEPIADRQEKLLVFTQFQQMTGPLHHHLSTCFGQPGLVLHGGTPVRQRAELVRRFQEDERVPYMVLSLKAGGTGLNLTAANHVIHFDRWWNPAVENQATDRAFRLGQRRNVLVQKFVCKGTVEERIDKLIADKQRMSDELLTGGVETRLTELSNDELIALVSLDLQSAVAS
jgi:superfamily II DNA or RNA helicase